MAGDLRIGSRCLDLELGVARRLAVVEV